MKLIYNLDGEFYISTPDGESEVVPYTEVARIGKYFGVSPYWGGVLSEGIYKVEKMECKIHSLTETE